MKKSSARFLGVALSGVLALGALSGCSDDADETPAAGTSAASADAESEGGTEQSDSEESDQGARDDETVDGEGSEDADGATEADDQITVRRDSTVRLNDQEGARADLSDFVCVEKDGQWSTSGTVNNPTDEDLVYVASVNIVYVEGRSSLIRQNFIMDVPANGSASFEEAEFVESDRDDLECTTRVVRGSSLIEGDE